MPTSEPTGRAQRPAPARRGATIVDAGSPSPANRMREASSGDTTAAPADRTRITVGGSESNVRTRGDPMEKPDFRRPEPASVASRMSLNAVAVARKRTRSPAAPTRARVRPAAPGTTAAGKPNTAASGGTPMESPGAA